MYYFGAYQSPPPPPYTHTHTHGLFPLPWLAVPQSFSHSRSKMRKTLMNGAIVGCSKMKGCIENCVCFVPYTRIESHVNELNVC